MYIWNIDAIFIYIYVQNTYTTYMQNKIYIYTHEKQANVDQSPAMM